MADYIGNTCPVCKNKFKDGDDIVVCPDCGTPYHRECWKKVGACVHEAEHAAGFEWVPDKPPEAAETDAICPNCGTHNPVGAQFCNHCGVPLPTGSTGGAAAAPGSGDAPAKPIYANSAQARQPGAQREPHIDAFAAGEDGSVYRREIGPEDDIGGIKARDWTSYIGASSLYYLMQFFRLEETHRKVCMSFSAFLLGPIYYFYRKMWKQGAFFAVLDLLLTLPAAFLLLVLSEAPLVAGLPTAWIVPAMNICSIAEWAAMVVRGLFSVYWYKQQCAVNIKQIYGKLPDSAERQDALALRGGVSIGAVVGYIAVMLCLGFALSALMGPNFSAIYSALSM